MGRDKPNRITTNVIRRHLFRRHVMSATRKPDTDTFGDIHRESPRLACVDKQVYVSLSRGDTSLEVGDVETEIELDVISEKFVLTCEASHHMVDID